MSIQWFAPLGYLNNPKTREINVDTEKATKVKKIFALYVTRNYNLRELAEWCKRVNLKSNLERDISISQVHKILQSIFYIGLMKYKGGAHEATHEPLISKKLWRSEPLWIIRQIDIRYLPNDLFVQ